MRFRGRDGQLCEIKSERTRGFAVALHEAGHLWIGHINGLQMHGVNTLTTVSRNVNGEADYSGGCAYTYNRGPPESLDEKKAYVKSALGGMAIELMNAEATMQKVDDLTGYDVSGSNDDMAIAKRRCEVWGIEYEDILDSLCQEIRRDYPKIVALAGIIHRKKRMNGKQLGAAVKKVEDMFKNED